MLCRPCHVTAIGGAREKNLVRARERAKFPKNVLFATVRRKKRTRKPRSFPEGSGIFGETSTLDARIWRSFREITQ
jgi:hypothetical protein